MGTVPRVLVATVVTDTKLYAFGQWERGLKGQRTFVAWDVLLACPYAPSWLHEWGGTGRQPFGADHQVRLKRPPSPQAGQQMVWEKFTEWRSYSHLLLLDLDILLPITYIQHLYDAQAPWAAGSGPPGPAAPMTACLLQRQALERGGEGFMPTIVAGVWWARLPRSQASAVAR